MNIPLSINGRILSEIDDALSDDQIKAMTFVKIVRVPGKLINVVVDVTGRHRDVTTLKTWTDQAGDHHSLETSNQPALP